MQIMQVSQETAESHKAYNLAEVSPEPFDPFPKPHPPYQAQTPYPPLHHPIPQDPRYCYGGFFPKS